MRALQDGVVWSGDRAGDACNERCRMRHNKMARGVLCEILDREGERWNGLEGVPSCGLPEKPDARAGPDCSRGVLVQARRRELRKAVVVAKALPACAVELRDTALAGRPDVTGAILQQRRDGSVEKAVFGGGVLIDAAIDDTRHAAEASHPEAAVARHEQGRKVVAWKRAAVPRLPGHEAHAVEAHESGGTWQSRDIPPDPARRPARSSRACRRVRSTR